MQNGLEEQNLWKNGTDAEQKVAESLQYNFQVTIWDNIKLVLGCLLIVPIFINWGSKNGFFQARKKSIANKKIPVLKAIQEAEIKREAEEKIIYPVQIEVDDKTIDELRTQWQSQKTNLIESGKSEKIEHFQNSSSSQRSSFHRQ